MKLQVAELKKFKAVAGTIKHNSILPILSYLRFDKGYVTKSNIHSFVSMETDCDGSFLVDEKILMSFVESVRGSEIDVEVTPKSVILSCGKEKVVSSTDEVKNFPNVSEDTAEEIELDEELLNQVKIAAEFTADREDVSYTQCVFVGNKLVAASTGYIAYTHPIDEKYPQMIFEKDIVAAISKFTSVYFSQTDKYSFFRNGIYRFGFSITETIFVNMKPFSVIPQGAESEEVDKDEIISFCEMCINSCQGRFVLAKVEGDKLVMDDPAFEVHYEKPLSSSLKPFMFNPIFMSKMLKSLPDEKVFFSTGTNKFYVTGSGSYVSLIMELVVNPSK